MLRCATPTRPHKHTLFPYTTLFRSPPGTEALASLKFRERIVRVNGDTIRSWNALLEDRKSTRLNSSHGYISYAVFCLKKKKKNKMDKSYTLHISRDITTTIYCRTSG